MSKLISDWFCVATSGPTIDGRDIRARWLQDMAETYDAGLYEGMLWEEHYRYRGNFGAIHSVKVEKGEDGLYRLYNRLVPSPQLQELNRQQQKLHSSIEVLTEFRGKKKAYQYGLGITDSPASVGTDRLSFSVGGETPTDEQMEMASGVCQALNAAKIAEYKARVPGVNQDHLEIFVSQPLPDLEFSKEKTIFDFNFSDLFGRKITTEEGKDDMDKAETGALIDDKLTNFGTTLMTELRKEFAKSDGKVDDKPPADEPEAPPAKPAVKPAANNHATDDEKFDALTEKFDGLSTQFEQLLGKLSKISDGRIAHSEQDGDGDKKQKPEY